MVFLFFIIVFYSLAVSFLSVYVYTPSGRRTTISALNPFAPGCRIILIKCSLRVSSEAISFNRAYKTFRLVNYTVPELICGE